MSVSLHLLPAKVSRNRQNYIELLQKHIKKDLSVFILSRRQGGPGIGSARAVLPRPRPDATRCAAPQLCADNKALMEAGPGSPSCGAATASIAVLTEGGTPGDRTPRCAAAAALCSGAPIHLTPDREETNSMKLWMGLRTRLCRFPCSFSAAAHTGCCRSRHRSRFLRAAARACPARRSCRYRPRGSHPRPRSSKAGAR